MNHAPQTSFICIKSELFHLLTFLANRCFWAKSGQVKTTEAKKGYLVPQDPFSHIQHK